MNPLSLKNDSKQLDIILHHLEMLSYVGYQSLFTLILGFCSLDDAWQL